MNLVKLLTKYNTIIINLPYNYMVPIFKNLKLLNEQFEIFTWLIDEWEFNEVPDDLKLKFNIKGFYNGINPEDPTILYIGPINLDAENYLNWVSILEAFHFETRVLPYKNNIFINVTDTCNCTCKGCSHFAPLVDKAFYKYDSSMLLADLDLIAEKFMPNRLAEIHFLGGEPLVHPDIENIIRYASQIFTNVKLEIDTNGLLIETLSESFLNFCALNNIIFSISSYNINFDYNKLKQFLEAKHLNYNIHSVEYSRNWLIQPEFDYSKQIVNYLNCNTHSHLYIHNTYSYNCIFANLVKYFNEYFNKNLPVNLGFSISYLDYYSIIDNFWNIPQLCGHCRGEGIVQTEWQLSNKNIYEWAAITMEAS